MNSNQKLFLNEIIIAHLLAFFNMTMKSLKNKGAHWGMPQAQQALVKRVN